MRGCKIKKVDPKLEKFLEVGGQSSFSNDNVNESKNMMMKKWVRKHEHRMRVNLYTCTLGQRSWKLLL